MRHKVPQFIDIEDKIFGPLSFRQAIYIAGSVGGGFAIFVGLEKFVPILPTIVRFSLAVFPLALGGALAFLKVNKRPFVHFLESFFIYTFKPKRYVWKKKEKTNGDIRRVNHNMKKNIVTVDEQYIPKISRSKIRDLAWSLDMDIEKNN